MLSFVCICVDVAIFGNIYISSFTSAVLTCLIIIFLFIVCMYVYVFCFVCQDSEMQGGKGVTNVSTFLYICIWEWMSEWMWVGASQYGSEWVWMNRCVCMCVIENEWVSYFSEKVGTVYVRYMCVCVCLCVLASVPLFFSGSLKGSSSWSGPLSTITPTWWCPKRGTWRNTEIALEVLLSCYTHKWSFNFHLYLQKFSNCTHFQYLRFLLQKHDCAEWYNFKLACMN